MEETESAKAPRRNVLCGLKEQKDGGRELEVGDEAGEVSKAGSKGAVRMLWLSGWPYRHYFCKVSLTGGNLLHNIQQVQEMVHWGQTAI